MPSLRELLASFHIEVDEKELREANEHVEGFQHTLRQVGNVLAEAFAVEAIREFTESQIRAGAELKVMAERLGTDTDELQALELAAGQAGVGVDALTTGLRFLNRNIGEASHGAGEQAQIFRQLGISIKNADGTTRDAGDVLGDLADHLAATEDTAKKTEIAMKLLGRGGVELVPLLNKGGAAFEEARQQMQELGGGLSKEFVEQAHEAEAANVRLEFSMKGLKSQIASALFPALGEVVKWMTSVTKSVIAFNKETNVLSTGLAFFGTVGAFKALGSLRDLAKVFGILKPTIGETILALGQFAVPLAIIGGLYLLFDDLYTLMTGGESVIGDTLDELFGFGTATQFAKDLNEAFSATLDLLKNVGSIIFNTLVYPFEEAFEAAKGVGEALGDIAGGHFAQAVADLKKAGDAMGAVNDKRGNKLLEGFEGLGDDFTLSKEGRRKKREAEQIARGETAEGYEVGGKNFVGPVLPPATHVPTNIYGHPLHVGGEGTVIHQTNTTKVDVHTSSDQPKAVGDAVGQGVASAQQRANDRSHTALRKP